MTAKTPVVYSMCSLRTCNFPDLDIHNYILMSCTFITCVKCNITIPLGYEPADLTVHPPPHKTIEGGFIFFALVSSVTKIFSPKKKWIL